MHEYLRTPNMLICVEGKGEGRKEGGRERERERERGRGFIANVTHSHWKGLLLRSYRYICSYM